MPNATEKEWILPSAIPFEGLKSIDLEECVYWLLDAMGAKDLEWRKGGTGAGSTDGGRDLEATFYATEADGTIEPQKWWVECKGRTGTVEPEAVKSAIVNAVVKPDLAWLVIATNSQFSNPTRDWVADWQRTHPSPRVGLWDRATLERYLCQHPRVVLRLFAQVLSIEGKARAMQTRFWEKLEYVSPELLAELWEKKENYPNDGMAVFAAIANEFAHGDITRRPWGGAISIRASLQLLMIGLENMTYLSIRAHEAGVEMQPIVRTIAYLITRALQHVPADMLTEFVEELIYRGKKEEFPDFVREMLIMPIAVQLLGEMTDVCTADCRRFLGIPRHALREEKDELDTYWFRFERDGLVEHRPSRYALIEQLNEPCVVGFRTNAKHHCPLVRFKPTVDNMEDLLRIVKKVAVFRKREAARKRREEKKVLEKPGKKSRAPKKPTSMRA